MAKRKSTTLSRIHEGIVKSIRKKSKKVKFKKVKSSVREKQLRLKIKQLQESTKKESIAKPTTIKKANVLGEVEKKEVKFIQKGNIL